MKNVGAAITLVCLATSALASSRMPANECEGRRILSPERRPFSGPPPKTMPDELRWAYTRCGAIEESKQFYVDDTRGGKGIHVKFNADKMRQQLEGARKTADLASPLKSLGKQGWVAEALKRHRHLLANASVLVVGSQQPTYETLALAFGAAEVTALEYQQLTYEHPQVATVTPAQVAAAPEAYRHAFDVALSISSYDHDGLGRYGDPLCPDGDLLSMDQLRYFYLKPGGTVFFTVPVGPDAVVWNLHRRYGRVRLPLLLEGWTVTDRIAWEEAMLTAPAPVTKSYEPVFVLQSPPAAGAGAGASAIPSPAGAAANAAAGSGDGTRSNGASAGQPEDPMRGRAARQQQQQRATDAPASASSDPAPPTSSGVHTTLPTESARRPGRLAPQPRDEL